MILIVKLMVVDASAVRWHALALSIGRPSLLCMRGPWRQLKGDHTALTVTIEALLLPKAAAHRAQRSWPTGRILKRAPVYQVMPCSRQFVGSDWETIMPICVMEMYSVPNQLYISSHWRTSGDVAVLTEYAAA